MIELEQLSGSRKADFFLKPNTKKSEVLIIASDTILSVLGPCSLWWASLRKTSVYLEKVSIVSQPELQMTVYAFILS